MTQIIWLEQNRGTLRAEIGVNTLEFAPAPLSGASGNYDKVRWLNSGTFVKSVTKLNSPSAIRLESFFVRY